MKQIVIDLGKGVELNAPIKERMTVDEWTRMCNYINGLLKGAKIQASEDIVIIKE